METYIEMEMLQRILQEIKMLSREITKLKHRILALENENQERRLENSNLFRRVQNDIPVENRDE